MARQIIESMGKDNTKMKLLKYNNLERNMLNMELAEIEDEIEMAIEDQVDYTKLLKEKDKIEELLKICEEQKKEIFQ